MKNLIAAVISAVLLISCAGSNKNSTNFTTSKPRTHVLANEVKITINDESFKVINKGQSKAIELYQNGKQVVYLNWNFSSINTKTISPQLFSNDVLNLLKEGSDSYDDAYYIDKDKLSGVSLPVTILTLKGIKSTNTESDLMQIFYMIEVDSGYLTIIATLTDDEYAKKAIKRINKIVKTAKKI